MNLIRRKERDIFQIEPIIGQIHVGIYRAILMLS